jgi:ABC-type sugar transport system ATPase subunit
VDSNVVLAAEGISKSFGGVPVLKNVDFTLRKNEIHALIGENGAGKSTLIKIISGDYTKDSGAVYLDGQHADFSNPGQALRSGIRVIHQEINLVRTMTVAENIFLGNFPRKKNGMIDWAGMNRQAKEVLDSLEENIPPTKKVRQLTIAEQQIIEIAKSLSEKPRVLIMDEPTAALNDQETSSLFRLLKKLKESGVSIIYITHRFSEMYELADRVTVLRDGSTVGTMDSSDMNDEKLIKMMVGDEKNALFVRRESVKGEPLFSIEGMNAVGALEDINLHINRGELVVVFGLFGAGQNELCRAIFGDLPLKSGEMYMKGKKLRIKSVEDACKNHIGYVPDDRKNAGIIPLLSVQENICLPSYPGLLSSALGIIKLEKAQKVAQQFFDKLHIKCKGLSQAIRFLSGGNQQKSMLARWVARGAELLVLNMPTRGVDVGARAEIYRVLEDLADQGVAVMAISLEMPEVLSIADRVYVMREHKIVAEVARKDATQEYLLAKAMGVEYGS